jgi:hypothetical protein
MVLFTERVQPVTELVFRPWGEFNLLPESAGVFGRQRQAASR